MDTQKTKQSLKFSLRSNYETDWYKFWEEKGFFKADPNSSKKPYSLLMPPPNLTGDLHPGQTMQYAILDTIARFKRMQGFDVLLLPGVDHAGIQFESTLNKKLAKEGLSKEKLGRDEWLKKAWEFKDEIYKSFHQTWNIIGLSADWSREVFTLDENVQKAVLEQFKTFWDQDLLYKGAYIVQWCPKDNTAIEDVEMEYEQRKEKLYYIKYRVIPSSSVIPAKAGIQHKTEKWIPDQVGDDKKDESIITIATARPETIAADVAIAIYPKHPKYSKFLGKMAENPFTHTKIPIIEDGRVEKDFGTGALKITPGHDFLDYQIGQTHKLPILHVISKNGRVTDLDPNLADLKILEAREKAVQILKEQGLIEKEVEYTHSVPVCERCKTTIEPLISEEWFVKMAPLAQKSLKYIKNINFVPKNYQKILSNWIKDVHDWSISRFLWWGHRIPVWYCQKCNPNHEVGKDKDMVISLEEPIDPETKGLKKCQTCKLSRWVQDEQVLDTWFSSGLWPISTLGWPKDSKELNRYYPWDFELTSPEIKYLWIARMIMLGLWFTQEIPFKNMFFHGTLRDLKGQKISKSLGNFFSPIELINQWGTDSVRMALLSYTVAGRDSKTSLQVISERCKNYRNFSTKLRNIARFVVDLKPSTVIPAKAGIHPKTEKWIPDKQSLPISEEIGQVGDDKLHPDDKKIIEKLNQTISEVSKNIESFSLHLATEKLYDFIWHDFADVYIESTKNRRIEAQSTLEYVLKNSLQLLHPFMPFITEELWQRLPHSDKSIMHAPWPIKK